MIIILVVKGLRGFLPLEQDLVAQTRRAIRPLQYWKTASTTLVVEEGCPRLWKDAAFDTEFFQLCDSMSCVGLLSPRLLRLYDPVVNPQSSSPQTLNAIWPMVNMSLPSRDEAANIHTHGVYTRCCRK